jgi:hypothetical protein
MIVLSFPKNSANSAFKKLRVFMALTPLWGWNALNHPVPGACAPRSIISPLRGYPLSSGATWAGSARIPMPTCAGAPFLVANAANQC